MPEWAKPGEQPEGWKRPLIGDAQSRRKNKQLHSELHPLPRRRQ